MDKNKDPAFLFYSSDFLTGTMFMSDEQVGKYIRLMCAQHQTGHLTEKHMINICKKHDDDIFSKFSIDENGLYYNKRLDSEIDKRNKYSTSRRNNRLGKKKEEEKTETETDNICETYTQTYGGHMENENENINKDIDISIKPKDINNLFETLWKLYPVKKGKGSVSDTQKKKLYAIGLEEMQRAVKRYCEEQKNTDKQFWKHGSTFFNKGYIDYLDANYEDKQKEGEDKNDEYDYDKFFV